MSFIAPCSGLTGASTFLGVAWIFCTDLLFLTCEVTSTPSNTGNWLTSVFSWAGLIFIPATLKALFKVVGVYDFVGSTFIKSTICFLTFSVNVLLTSPFLALGPGAVDKLSTTPSPSTVVVFSASVLWPALRGLSTGVPPVSVLDWDSLLNLYVTLGLFSSIEAVKSLITCSFILPVCLSKVSKNNLVLFGLFKFKCVRRLNALELGFKPNEVNVSLSRTPGVTVAFTFLFSL